jgi:cytochrome c oxidase assembly protein subunit 15
MSVLPDQAASGQSRATAIWLFAVAALVFAMIIVGGATRLTDSGLSITEWKPVTGAVPPLNAAEWAAEFARYKATPEYRYVNAGMSLEQFKVIYGWEWGHRFLGRLIGLAFALPFLVLLLLRRLPKRLIPACLVLFALGGLQGLVGWWMVASGLIDRVDVAPERLAVHFGLALILFGALIWTGLRAWAGPRASASVPARWSAAAWALVALVYLQLLLGALVAGNDAGLIHNDWPLMSGRLVPDDYAGEGLWGTLAHSRAAVQLHHRLLAYVLLVATFAFAWIVSRRESARPLRSAAWALAGLVTAQAVLGVATLVALVPVSLGILHQAGAVLVFTAALAVAWRASGARQEAFVTAWTPSPAPA